MKSRTPSYMLTPRTSFSDYRSMNPNQEASHPINTTVEGFVHRDELKLHSTQ